MPRTILTLRNLGMTLTVIVAIGGLVEASTFNLRITTIGAMLIAVAVLEAVLIFAGLILLQRQRQSSLEALESMNG